MIRHAWFIVAAIVGQPDSPVPAALVQGRYPTWAACMIDAHRRTLGLRAIGVHGRYLCMYHRAPDRVLSATPIGLF